MVGKKRLDTRDYADFTAAYGLDGNPVDYDTFVGLWLNLDRVRLQRAWQIANGIRLAYSSKPLSLEVAEAITTTPEDSQTLRKEMNMALLEERLKAQYGWPDE